MESELRILLLEDSPQDAEFVKRELRREGMSFIARRVDSRESFVIQLAEFRPDLIISDYLLPSFDGLTALLLTRERFPDLPFILVSGYIGEERATEALKSGATDFLLKPSLSVRLVPTVQRAMREVEERAERKRLEEMLRQAQKMEAVGQLTGGLAHDFNNLLTIIVGSLELLLTHSEVDARAQEMGQSALRASLRGAELTRQLLAFSRRQSLETRHFDLNELVAGTTELLRRTLGEDTEIELHLGADVWPALADPTQLEAALTNLAVNARDAMPKGGRLTIETANKSLDAVYAARNVEVTPGEYVMLAVSDTGTGMPPEILDRVFEPFFTTKEAGKGTGLGLSMVYGFAKQSGGHIKIYSEVGRGTTVRLYLPRGAADQKSLTADPPENVGDVAAGATILVVEDDADVRSVAINQLMALGYRVMEAKDGKVALALLGQDQSVDLLFTDVVMPGGMSGPDLAREARTIRPALKILFTSGYAEAAVGRGGQISEYGRLLAKPYLIGDLARKVREALAGKQASP
jgi:two-component system cell cycle sensor histidine kinase/response regulator CckA